MITLSKIREDMRNNKEVTNRVAFRLAQGDLDAFLQKLKGIELLIQSTKILDKNLGKDKYVILMAGPTKVIGENYFDFLHNNDLLLLKKCKN